MMREGEGIDPICFQAGLGVVAGELFFKSLDGGLGGWCEGGQANG